MLPSSPDTYLPNRFVNFRFSPICQPDFSTCILWANREKQIPASTQSGSYHTGEWAHFQWRQPHSWASSLLVETADRKQFTWIRSKERNWTNETYFSRSISTSASLFHFTNFKLPVASPKSNQFDLGNEKRVANTWLSRPSIFVGDAQVVYIGATLIEQASAWISMPCWAIVLFATVRVFYEPLLGYKLSLVAIQEDTNEGRRDRKIDSRGNVCRFQPLLLVVVINGDHWARFLFVSLFRLLLLLLLVLPTIVRH